MDHEAEVERRAGLRSDMGALTGEPGQRSRGALRLLEVVRRVHRELLVVVGELTVDRGRPGPHADGLVRPVEHHDAQVGGGRRCLLEPGDLVAAHGVLVRVVAGDDDLRAAHEHAPVHDAVLLGGPRGRGNGRQDRGRLGEARCLVVRRASDVGSGDSQTKGQ